MKRFVFFLVFVVITTWLSAAPVAQWQRWEHAFESTKSYEDPYRDVRLLIHFRGPNGASFWNYGFWKEGHTFIIRAAFPSAGTWRWESFCSDNSNKSLHRRKGKVVVKPYRGKNPLYQKGFLKVSADKRMLACADGSPFLWMGDTGWFLFMKSTDEEWRDYIDNRAAKDFTIVQVLVSGSRAPILTADGEGPFKLDRPNDLFWSNLEKKVQYANDKGIVVFLVGLGAGGKGGYVPEMNSGEFARYLAARMAGNFIIYSPSMDAHYDPRNDEVGMHLKQADSLHLVTQHVGTDLDAAEQYHPKAYLDFTCIQSGHHGGRVERAYDAARNWSSILWHKTPTKPVINAEGMYDGHGNDNARHWREMDVRKIGWLSWLSGAHGYTYGAGENKHSDIQDNGGVWLFNTDTSTFDYWRKAMDWNSAHQMTLMKRFFASIDWWTLKPAPGRIQRQPEDPLQVMAASVNEAGNLLVAYLPDDPEIALDTDGMVSDLHARWYNPRTGEYLDARESAVDNAYRTFTTPGSGDWVLILSGNNR